MTDALTFRLALSGIALFVAAAAIGPWHSHPNYSSVVHSLSELAGQNMPGAWVMQAGFIAFGAAVALAAMLQLRGRPASSAALIVFGLAMIAAAIWSHLPIDPALGGSAAEDDIHTIAASTMGAAFVIAAALGLMRRRFATSNFLGWLALGAAILFPVAMAALPDFAGVFQRIMFGISFVWILREMGPQRGAAARRRV
jgi:hypothetical membrane protein